jgi:hypothetical protein
VVIQQSCNGWFNDKNYVAAFATVSAIRTAKWFKFFTVDRRATVATVATLHVENNSINECCHVELLSKEKRAQGGPANRNS